MSESPIVPQATPLTATLLLLLRQKALVNYVLLAELYAASFFSFKPGKGTFFGFLFYFSFVRVLKSDSFRQVVLAKKW